MKTDPKKEKRVYKEYRKKFHLDFIPDFLCSEVDCMNEGSDETEFCSKIGCPIRKMRKELMDLELDDDFKKIDVNEIVQSDSTSIALKNAIKLKWDYMRLCKDDNAPNVKFRIVYFYNNKDKKIVIYEPFPKNRFDTEFDAVEFLEKYCRETKENPEDYYIASVVITSDKDYKELEKKNKK